MAVDERWYKLGPASKLIKLEGVEFREYQFNILDSILRNGNTLVVLPTGLGKTFIGIATIAHYLANGKRAMMLAPTKPLAEQHFKVLTERLKISPDDILLLTGAAKKKVRSEMENKVKIIVATPQTVANDLKDGALTLDGFGTVVFDECHRAVGKYAYTYIANESVVRDVHILGLTASPGSKREKIKSIAETLNIHHIEARISTDPDVVRYVMPKFMHIVNVDLSDRVKEIGSLLKPLIEHNLKSLNNMGLMPFKRFENIPKGRLIQIGTTISKIQARNYRFGAMFSYIRLLNLVHAYDLLMTEGIYPFSKYFESLDAREKKSRAVLSILADPLVVKARASAAEALKNGEEHPKVIAVLDVIKDYKGKSAIIFAQYRSTIKMLTDYINNNGLVAVPFVGKKEGITQMQQKQVIEDFRARKFDILVASSIGEEGLDIPSVDLVLFYEPIPNEIRNIQRRGRTGRFRSGDIYILVAKNTKDEVYLYVSQARERKMLQLIDSINMGLAKKATNISGQKTL